MKKHHTIIPAIALSLVALAGCSSDSETASTPSPTATTPLDLGTYIPSTRDATPTASASTSSSSGGTAASGITQTTATPVAGSTAVPTLASGKSVEFTDEELAKYQAGEYVAATEKHPAYNVPVPVIPAEAKENSDAGAKAFVEYWIETQNYTIQTGDGTYELSSINEDTYTEQQQLIDFYNKTYSEGGWVSDCLVQTKVDVETAIEVDFSDATIVTVIPKDDKCSVFDKDGNVTEQEEAITYNNQKSLVNLDWQDGHWLVREPSGIPGVDYGK